MKILIDGNVGSEQKEELRQLLEQVRHYYALAEDKLKLIESVELKLVIPAANQLRYAGCHLSRACVEGDILVACRDLDKAQRHCKRAIYDSLEVGITNFLEDIKVFQNDYRLVPITSVLSDYIDLTDSIQRICDYIRTTRDFQREEYWTKCTDYFEEIKNIAKRLELSRTELNKLESAQAISSKRHYITLALAVIGTAATIIATWAIFSPPQKSGVSAQEYTVERSKSVLTNDKDGMPSK